MTLTQRYFESLKAAFPGRAERFNAAAFPAAAVTVPTVFSALAREYLRAVILSEEHLALHREWLALYFGVTPARPAAAVPGGLADRVLAGGLDGLPAAELLHLTFDAEALASLHRRQETSPYWVDEGLQLLEPSADEHLLEAPSPAGERRPNIAEAVAEAESLPPEERPASRGELARWVKTRLHGFAPLPAGQFKDYLVAFGLEILRRPPAATDAADDWSNLPAGSPLSTVLARHEGTDPAGTPVPRAVERLLQTDRTIGELLVLGEYAGQPAAALARLTGLPEGLVASHLVAAAEWVRDEVTHPPTAAAGR